MELQNGIQTFLSEAGEASCYALSLIKVAELKTQKTFPIVSILIDCIQDKYILYNWNDPNDNNNFYVQNPQGMIEYLTGIKCTVEKKNANYVPLKNQFIIDRWERVKTGTVTGHFNMLSQYSFDSLFDSQTVKYGKIVSKRVITFKE